MELVLVRHGETQDNEDGTITGQRDPGLSERGKCQARRAGDVLRGERFDAVYSSDLRRAHRTAAIIAAPHGEKPVQDPAFREVGYGRFEGGPKTAYHDWLERTGQDRWNARPGGGERMQDAAERFRAGAERLREEHRDRVLLVAHGVVIRAFLVDLMGLGPEWCGRLSQDNTGITRMSHDGLRWELRALNAIAHLGAAH